MKQIKNVLLISISIIIFLFGCDNKETNIQSEVKISKDMQMFLYLITGDNKDFIQAMNIYAANEKLHDHEICLYDLNSPHVIDKEENTYTVNFKAGFTTRQYCFQWEEDKITDIYDRGIQ